MTFHFSAAAMGVYPAQTGTYTTSNVLTSDSGSTGSTLVDSAGGTYPTDEEFVNAIASLSSKINVMAVAINKILERLQ